MNHEHYLKISEKIATMGRCKRRQIGAILTDSQGNILADGWNGPPNCIKSCFERACEGADVPAGAGATQKVACMGVHAEMAALLKVKNVSDIFAVYSNKAPCQSCVLTMLNTNCRRIVFRISSNETKNRELWENAGREWIHLP